MDIWIRVSSYSSSICMIFALTKLWLRNLLSSTTISSVHGWKAGDGSSLSQHYWILKVCHPGSGQVHWNWEKRGTIEMQTQIFTISLEATCLSTVHRPWSWHRLLYQHHWCLTLICSSARRLKAGELKVHQEDWITEANERERATYRVTGISEGEFAGWSCCIEADCLQSSWQRGESSDAAEKPKGWYVGSPWLC